MKKTLLIAAATAALAQAATAATATANVTGNPQLSVFTNTDYTGGWTVDKFNTLGGTLTLTGVSIKVTGTGQSRITNNSLQTDNFTASANVNFQISGFTPAPFTHTVVVTIPSTSLTAGSTSGFFPNTTSGTVNATDLGNWADPAGSGTVSIPLSVSTTSASTSGGGGNSALQTQGQAQIEVTYTYTTTDVPEPSFYGAMGALVCFGLLGYRQYRMKQNA